MKLNRGGKILCSIYTVIVIGLWTLAYFADFKGAVVARQLSAFPAALFLNLTGAMTRDGFAFSWLDSFFVLIPLSLLIVYAIGWGFSAILNGIVAFFSRKGKWGTDQN